MRRLLLVLLLIGFTPLASGANANTILVWGDSLSSAYGLPVEAGWVSLLGQRLREQGYPHVVVNGSVTGETTSGGAARLAAALARNKPKIVMIELGGNDGLRGQPLAKMKANLSDMVRRSRAAGAKVLVFEMRIPPNYGAAYTEGFTRTFAEVATGQATLVPFFLEPIAADPRMFQEDGIHPTVAAQPLLLDAVWPVLAPVLGRKPVQNRASVGAAQP